MPPTDPLEVEGSAGHPEQMSWRVPKWARISACVVLVPVATFFACVGAISGAPEIAIAFAVGIPFGLWRCAFVPRIEVDRHALEVVNPFGNVSIPANDVKRVSSGYAGIEIDRRTGRSRLAWAVQQSNFIMILGRKNRSDRVVEAIQMFVNEGLQLDHSAAQDL